ncbi:MAG: amino acid ABC transporter substrate-binding protein [Anaerolineae bacterium]|uniref:amino acid ABC transporter substrate-binding protein n=1 Tax=Promineifilum sp. TaxID=2664178 RepID=UPI001D4A999D|nr:amino acid ABC transporter substrate-binding protein [Anaerolineales bacterium]MCB8933939.1 amino acid ABC transporter substrate-binding protein [Promineifilum sp.]MCO5179340.1 amino acid ABC transporter substrate-binding protein [Promineifilum sp.]MCW5845946.1 amino acid ABC transporter substrate-binding protein [Anaerolineae bacterium]
MKAQLSLLLAMMVVLALALAACGGQVQETTPTEAAAEVVATDMPAEAATEAPAEATEAPAAPTGNTLEAVRSRGTLRCAGNQSVPGFGYINPDTNEFEGFDIDFCRVFAVAALGDATALEVRPTTANERFPVLQSGEVDVLSRNTTMTISRDTSLGLDFAPVTFYDGQGMMVRADMNIDSLEGLEGGTICVQSGTTTEKNLADVFRARGIDFTPVVFDDADATRDAYDQGQCDGFTTDKSGLVSQQILLADPAAHIILDETMSKEPLAPAVRHGDNNWGDIIRWSVYCTIAAEELGIDSTNVDSFMGGEDPVIQNLLGETGDLGVAMGISNDFCYQIIKQVGNYGEIYDRNLGPDTPFNLPRGLNALYTTEGGIQYAPPFR